MSNDKGHPLENQNNDNQDGSRKGDLLREYRQHQQYSPQSSTPLDDSKEPVTSSSSKETVLPERVVKESSPVDAAQKPLTPGEMPMNGTIGSVKDEYTKKDVPSSSAKERARSGSPSLPGIPSRTRLARIEEPTPQVASPAQNQPGFLSTTVQMVRRLTGAMTAINHLTGKMATINKAVYEPPAPPMVLYRPPLNIAAEMHPRTPSWHRSRALRTAWRKRQRRVREQHSGPSIHKIAISLFLTLLVALVALLSSGSAYAYSFYQSQLPQVDNIAHKQINQVSRIYDRNGVFLGDVYDPNGAGRRTYVDINSIPQVMQDAMVAAENRTFWTDPGIDPSGITRAAIDYVSHGFTVEQGASTLTQQLVKDMTNNTQITLNRKLNEGAVAIGLTQQFSKEKILEMYLNVAPFGNLRLGVESASQEYFGLSRQCTQNFAKGTFACIPAVAQLDYDPVTKTHSPVLALARATFLASMPQDPSDYDPTMWSTRPQYRTVVLARQQGVISAMRDMGTLVQGLGPNGKPGPITAAVQQQIVTMMDKMPPVKNYQLNWKDPAFMYWTISQVEHALGNGDSAEGAIILQNGGYNIRTTIDSNLEAYVERVIKHQLDDVTPQKFLPTPFAILSRDYNVGDAAAVVMNSKTGEILAMAGSKDYNNTAKDPRVDGNYNVVTDGLGRQPGSSFKPIVYATALEMGMYPGIVLPDTRTYFPNGHSAGTAILPPAGYDPKQEWPVWAPNDYGEKPGNWVLPLRDDLADSYNIPAAKVMAFAGIDNVYNTALRMGLDGVAVKAQPCIKNKQPLGNYCGLGTAIALGTIEIPLIQLAGAYQVFSDQGARVPQQSVLDIWDNYGNHLYHFDPNHVQKAQVLSPQVAFMITAMMSDEPARAREFYSDHDLSFWDWDPTCQTQIYTPMPDCQQHQVAAKTGTTESFNDNLTLGYTPDAVVAVWAGNADGNDHMAADVVGITGAAPIWHSIIERISGKPCSDADGVVCGPLDVNSLGLSNQGVFTNPGGLETKCVSPVDGLMATNSSNCDLILPGQEPLQQGVYATTSTTNNGGTNNGGDNNGGGANNGGGNNNGGGRKKNG